MNVSISTTMNITVVFDNVTTDTPPTNDVTATSGLITSSGMTTNTLPTDITTASTTCKYMCYIIM